MYILFSKER